MEVNGSDSQLVLVEPPQKCQLESVTCPQSAVVVDVTTAPTSTPHQDRLLEQLAHMVAAQKELLQRMESEQHTTRVAVQVEIQRLREGLLEEQKTMMAEFKREQRILYTYIIEKERVGV